MPDMRFAPPNPLRIADRASGLNAVSVRSYNERLVLSLLLQSKDITRLEIGERTGLSAQTLGNVARKLAAEGFIVEGDRVVAGPGKPRTPLQLDRTARYAVGIHLDPSCGQDVEQVLGGLEPVAQDR